MSPLAFAAAAMLLASAANAHFLLDYPATIGFSDETEGTGPCGGFTPNFASDNLTDFYVGGDNVAIKLLHSQGTWLFRATLDESASGNWTQLFPQVQQNGLGFFCEPSVTVPASWAGSKGVISAIVDASDGLLYQCASVNFVAGVAPASQSTCTNSSGVTAAFSTDDNLTPLAGSSSNSPSASSTASATPSATSAQSGASARFSSVLAAAAVAVMGAAIVVL